MARILQHIENGIKRVYTNIGETEYGRNNRAANGDVRTTRQVRQDELKSIKSVAKKVVNKIKSY